MLILDQLSRGDEKIRNVSFVVFLGLLLLVGILWHLQIFSSGKYVQRLEKQVYRTVREPAVRGEVFDCNGVVMAASRPAYSINLYLGELSKSGLFNKEYRRIKALPEYSELNVWERSRVARFNVVSNTLFELSGIIGEGLYLNEQSFNQHYQQTRALPLTVLQDASPEAVARFMESPMRPLGVGIEFEPFREYPFHEVGSHILGYLLKRQVNDPNIQYSYQAPDFVGQVGIEGKFDKKLRGLPGMKSVLVDNIGYRQEENTLIVPVMGQDIILTIDSRIQETATSALRSVQPDTRGAVVVVDVRNGDILALVSEPSYDPNLFIPRISRENWQIYNNEETTPTLCRATYGAYAPGSIFKIIVGLAILENGIDPEQEIYCEGHYKIGNRVIDDTAPAGNYNFKRAFLRSSNAYFIDLGLKVGLEQLMSMGNRFFLGEKTGVPIMQEVRGFFPDPNFIQRQRQRGMPWLEGHTANLCIGQGDITVTPLQMAMMTAAIANGGTVFWPRLVKRIETRNPMNDILGEEFQEGVVRGEIGVSQHSLKIIQDSMLADVEDAYGTGSRAEVRGMRVCGKTGTAEVKQGNRLVRKDTWFVSYAPYNSPRYAVVVLVENGRSGGISCAPVAKKIYEKLLSIEVEQWRAEL